MSRAPRRPPLTRSGRLSWQRVAHPNNRELQARRDDDIPERPQVGKDSQLDSPATQLGDCVRQYLDACRHHGSTADEVPGALVKALECLVWQGVAIQATLL